MIALLATIIAAIAAFSAFSYQSLVSWKSYEVASLTQRNAARLAEVAVVLRPSLWVDATGTPRAPLGVAGADGRLHLPASVVGDDTAPWGTRYAWCPVAIPPAPGAAAPTGTAATVPDGGGRAGYATTTVAAARLGAPPLAYVVASSGGPDAGPAADGVVGFLVSAVPYGRIAPSCADVAWRGAVPVVVPSSGGVPGTAVAIDSRGTVLSAAAELTAAASDLRVAVAPTTLGDGGGEDPADAMALGDAVRLWRRVLPRSTVFVMTPGRYAPSADDADLSTGDPSRGLRLYSATPGAAILTGAVDVALDGDATLDGVATEPGVDVVARAGSRVGIVASALSHVTTQGGTLRIDASSNLGGLRALAGATTVGAGVAGPGLVSSVEVVDGDLAVDGVAVAPSAASVLLSGTGRVSLLRGGTIGGAATPVAPARAACGAAGQDGTTSCTATCDRVHPRIRLPSCGGDGVSLAGLATSSKPDGDVLTCSFRPWGPLVERQVLSADGNGATTGAVDVDPGSPAPSPSAAATCSTNP